MLLLVSVLSVPSRSWKVLECKIVRLVFAWIRADIGNVHHEDMRLTGEGR